MNVGGRGSTAHKLEENHFGSCVNITLYRRSRRGSLVKGLTNKVSFSNVCVEQHKGVNVELTVVMVSEVHVEVGCDPAQVGYRGLQGGVDQGLVEESISQGSGR